MCRWARYSETRHEHTRNLMLMMAHTLTNQSDCNFSTNQIASFRLSTNQNAASPTLSRNNLSPYLSLRELKSLLNLSLNLSAIFEMVMFRKGKIFLFQVEGLKFAYMDFYLK